MWWGGGGGGGEGGGEELHSDRLTHVFLLLRREWSLVLFITASVYTVRNTNGCHMFVM